VIFKTAAYKMDAIGQQGGSKRITSVAHIAAPVESEGALIAAINAAPNWQAEPLPFHDERPGISGGASFIR
jgi:hypothetical protein